MSYQLLSASGNICLKYWQPYTPLQRPQLLLPQGLPGGFSMHSWCGALAVFIPALSLNNPPRPLMKSCRLLLSKRGSVMHLLLLTESL